MSDRQGGRQPVRRPPSLRRVALTWAAAGALGTMAVFLISSGSTGQGGVAWLLLGLDLLLLAPAGLVLRALGMGWGDQGLRFTHSLLAALVNAAVFALAAVVVAWGLGRVRGIRK